MKVFYGGPKIGADGRYVIAQANRILEDYTAQGFDLTLRQLYYQFVARGLFPSDRTWRWTGSKWVRDPDGTPNADPNYKWLGDIVNNGRMSGLIDWDHIVDRTRNLKSEPHWSDPASLVKQSSQWFAIDKWADQPFYVETWIEKDALVGVIEPTCSQWDVPFFSCRGYTSQSEMWGAAQRIRKQMEKGKRAVILHLGDHDPSGIDMTRDIEDRLTKFMAYDHYGATSEEERAAMDEAIANGTWPFHWVRDNFEVQRLALNMEQIEQFQPPPNPAKMSDARAKRYVAEYGDESWELDALDPATLAGLIEGGIDNVLDHEAWEEAESVERGHKQTLKRISERFSEVADLVDG